MKITDQNTRHNTTKSISPIGKRNKEKNNGMQIIHTSFKSNPDRALLSAVLKHAGEFIKKRV